MKLKLETPCNVSADSLLKNTVGWHCTVCKKDVVDYSTMSPEQITTHIQQFGLGCGSVTRRQLQYAIKPHKHRNLKPVYILGLSLLLSLTALAQDSCKAKTNDTVYVYAYHSGYTTERKHFGGLTYQQVTQHRTFFGRILYRIKKLFAN